MPSGAREEPTAATAEPPKTVPTAVLLPKAVSASLLKSGGDTPNAVDTQSVEWAGFAIRVAASTTVAASLLAGVGVADDPLAINILLVAGAAGLLTYQTPYPVPFARREKLEHLRALAATIAPASRLVALVFAFAWFSDARSTNLWVLLGLALLAVPPLLFGADVAGDLLQARTSKTRVRRAIIVGSSRRGLELASRIAGKGDSGFHLLGIFEDRSADRAPSAATHTLLGHVEDVAPFVRSSAVDVIFISLPLASHPRVLRLIRALHDTTASVYFLPDPIAFEFASAHVGQVEGVPVLPVCENPMNGEGAILKRALDLIFAGAGVLCLWPLMLVIALAIKYESPGPVIFKQRRYGIDARPIFVYKFRTMSVCEDGGVIVQASKDDKRVTRLGRILRKTSLDELPQLFNVLFGTMSLVGPRPHAVAHNEYYRKLIDCYMVRHKVKPGITGWAQVNGCRGETAKLEDMKRRIDYDLEYFRNWSVLLDLYILVKTVAVVFRFRNTW